MMEKKENVFLTVRIKQSDLNTFKKHCSEELNRRHSDVVREMMTALIEGRLKIEATDAMKGMYK